MACLVYVLQLLLAIRKHFRLIWLSRDLGAIKPLEVYGLPSRCIFLCRSAAWHGTMQGGFLLQETAGKPPSGLSL